MIRNNIKTVLIFSFIAVSLAYVSISHAVVFRTFFDGIQLGDENTVINASNEELILGIVAPGSANGSLILLGHGQAGDGSSDRFRIGLNGDITSNNGFIDAPQLCLQNGTDCITNWAQAGGGVAGAINNQNIIAQTASFRISNGTGGETGSGELGSLRVVPSLGTTGVQVITADQNALTVRNNTDTQDIFVIDELGSISGQSITFKGRSIGNSSSNIAWNAGQGNLNVDLDANYIEGRDWNDVTGYVSTNYPPPPSPEKHYFISNATTNGSAGGYFGLDAMCNSDVKALPGRSYHVWADNSGRDFVEDEVYSNSSYGTFLIQSGSPDPTCLVPGIGVISCDTIWKIDSPSTYSWNTSINSCNDWTSTSGSASRKYRIIDNPNPTGTLSGNSGFGNCGIQYNVLCLEDSGNVYTDPGSVCGDGFVTTGEFCDDGNTVDDTTCPSNCQADGGICGDGYRATDEVCDYNEVIQGSTLLTRNKCTNACVWQVDSDADGYDGQTDCWNRATNNDNLAYPGSSEISTSLSKDMNCDGTISSSSVCSSATSKFDNAHNNNSQYNVDIELFGNQVYEWKNPTSAGVDGAFDGIEVCPSNNTKEQADLFCQTWEDQNWFSGWRCNGNPYWEVECIKCLSRTYYYW